MTYPQNFEEKIGFDKIRSLICDRCLSTLGSERVAGMQFQTSFDTIDRLLHETEEFTHILQTEDNFPADYFFDIRSSLQRIRIEGTFLDETELFNLRRSLETIRHIVGFFINEEESPYPHLQALAGNVVVFPQLLSRIDQIIDKFGHVKDNASTELSQIRRELNRTLSSISRSLNMILRNAQSEGIVDKEVSPTLREGRLVIPVIPAYKRRIKGIVHDESASGKTVYIEPAEVVEANNRIRELEGEERREIIRILTLFTDELRPHLAEIAHSYEFLADIDFIRAKALFAIEINALLPHFENCRQTSRPVRHSPYSPTTHIAHFRAERRREIGLSQNNRTIAIYAAMRIAHTGIRKFPYRNLRPHLHRYRRRTIDRERPQYLQFPLDEHEVFRQELQ